MAVLVVHGLEVVDVEEHERERLTAPRMPGELALEELEQMALVVQTGQSVEDRQLVELIVVGGLDVGPGEELLDGVADAQLVAVPERLAHHALVVDEAAVGAAEILEVPPGCLPDEASVAP